MILIVEDREAEKIGEFARYLSNQGLAYIVAENLENAKRTFDDNKDKISSVILDFAVPTSKDDKTESDENRNPNGIRFLLDNEFAIFSKMIDLVINTSADKETVEANLKKTRYFNKKRPNTVDLNGKRQSEVLHISNEKQPLGELTQQQMVALAKLLSEREKELLTLRKYNLNGNSNKEKGTMADRMAQNGGKFEYDRVGD